MEPTGNALRQRLDLPEFLRLQPPPPAYNPSAPRSQPVNPRRFIHSGFNSLSSCSCRSPAAAVFHIPSGRAFPAAEAKLNLAF